MGRGRGRGKGKKQTPVATRDDLGSAEEEKIPASKRRGRPQKPLKDDVEEHELNDKLENGEDDGKSSVTSRNGVDQIVADNGAKRRKRSSQFKENSDDIKEENGSGINPGTEDSIKPPVGFRHNGSRRKNKPRRAAEVGVECK